ncbi:unnamed protein product [Plutella xylostella]|uniref:(diamondback moth) hypothetical protein n=1 Tax=Plutella xylostella TaxID=51655 RepID=A0A8S4DDH5_PLUXY|nr:unnamed protein product [Plutella xylostella]
MAVGGGRPRRPRPLRGGASGTALVHAVRRCTPLQGHVSDAGRASSSCGGRGASVARARVIPAAARHHTPVPAPLASSAAAQTSRQVPKTSEQVPPTQCQFVLK